MDDDLIQSVLDEHTDVWQALADAITCGYCGSATTVDSGYQCTCGRILCPACGKKWGWCKDHVPLCFHPELRPTEWEQKRPGPAAMVGSCKHNLTCPVCGFGWASWPDPCEGEK